MSYQPGLFIEKQEDFNTNWNEIFNDSYYSTFRWEIYRGGAKVSGPGELTIGQELLMSNCSYKQRYTLRILNYNGLEIASVIFYMYIYGF